MPGAILRHAIPIGVLLWSWIEMLAAMDAISECYLHPSDFPVATALTGLAAMLALGVVYRGLGARV